MKSDCCGGGFAPGARGRNERDADQARKEPDRRLHLSCEHLVAQVGKEIDPYIYVVCCFRVTTSEDVVDECIGPS